MLNKIKVYIIILKVWIGLLFLILKDTSFLYLHEGATGKFKLFGKQYMKQARYEASGKKPKSKSVTFITSLSKSFSGDADSREGKFKLFGKQYIKQARYEKSGKNPKTKSVTYITALSKSFSGEPETREAEFKELLKYTFLWYTFSKYMQLEPLEDDQNEDSKKS